MSFCVVSPQFRLPVCPDDFRRHIRYLQAMASKYGKLFSRWKGQVLWMTFQKSCTGRYRKVFEPVRGLGGVGVVGGTGVALLWTAGLWRKTSATKDSETKALDSQERLKHNAIMKKADELYNNYLIDHVYNGLIRFSDSEYPEMLWRLARATCEKAKLSRSKEQKKELFNEAFTYIERALASEPPQGIFAVHKWYAILLNYKTEYDGTKEQIRRSMDVKEHLEKAISLDSTDPTTWHILGLWHFTFADMPSYQRYVVSLIFAKPPESDYSTALRHFEKAEEIQPNFYSKNSLMIGKTLMKLHENDRAVGYLESAFKRMVVSVDDYEAHTEAAALLKKLGINKN